MLTSPGIGSGLDVNSIVSQLVSAEAQPSLVRLSTKEADIQSELSALGSLKSALAEFRGVLEPLKDVETFRSRAARSGDEDLFTVTADTDAVPGSYSIDVLALAQVHKIQSGTFVNADPEQSNADTAVGYGNLAITVGEGAADTFNIAINEDDNTLGDIRDAINAAPDNKGVLATIVDTDDGARLVLTGTRTGADQRIAIAGTGGDGGLAVLDYDPDTGGPSVSEIQAASDASLSVDGNIDTRSTNTVAGVIDGVTLTLTGAAPGSPATLSVEFDADAAKTKVREFVDGYNQLVTQLASLGAYDAETESGGALVGDSTLRQVQSSIRRELQNSIGDFFAPYRELSAIGVDTDLEGRLDIDDSALSLALDTDFDAVGRLFGADDGVATRIDALLDPYLEADGQLDVRTGTLESQIEQLGEERLRLDERLARLESRYLAQFTALDTLISELNNTSQFLSQQLATLPTPGSG